MKEKIFWVAVCAICCAAAVYEITQIVVLYRENGVATKIHVHGYLTFLHKQILNCFIPSWTKQSLCFFSVSTVTYPTLLLCPTKWLSKKLVRQYDIAPEVPSYLMSIFEVVVPATSSPSSTPSFPSHLKHKIHDVSRMFLFLFFKI